MAITTTGLMKQQLMRQPTDITPQTGMDGGVTRASMAGDLMKAMNDLDFKQLLWRVRVHIPGGSSDYPRPGQQIPVLQHKRQITRK